MERIAFTVTKIQPPRPRANLIERTSLELRQAEAIATRRLTLLSAPAGFGKTTALTRQLASLPSEVAVAWIAADEDDDLQPQLTSRTGGWAAGLRLALNAARHLQGIATPRSSSTRSSGAASSSR